MRAAAAAAEAARGAHTLLRPPWQLLLLRVLGW